MNNSEADIIIISGAFGVGKTEIALNLAYNSEEPVTLIDLDIVNLYYRSRHHKKELEAAGVHLISSVPGFENADVPALSPGIYGALRKNQGKIILDIGGSDLGSTVLSSLKDDIQRRTYKHFLVINPFRPFNNSVEAIEEMTSKIEAKSQLEIHGIIANPHLMEDTNVETIKKGLQIIQAWGRIPITHFACTGEYCRSEELQDLIKSYEIVEITRRTKAAWEGW
jgi:tRNA A37 N6-isopentenylltransferase MiaA